MTPAEFRAARKTLGLTQAQCATALRMTGSRSVQTISEWETGRRAPSAMAAELMRVWLAGYRPADWPTAPDPQS